MKIEKEEKKKERSNDSIVPETFESRAQGRSHNLLEPRPYHEPLLRLHKSRPGKLIH